MLCCIAFVRRWQEVGDIINAGLRRFKDGWMDEKWRDMEPQKISVIKCTEYL